MPRVALVARSRPSVALSTSVVARRCSVCATVPCRVVSREREITRLVSLVTGHCSGLGSAMQIIIGDRISDRIGKLYTIRAESNAASKVLITQTPTRRRDVPDRVAELPARVATARVSHEP